MNSPLLTREESATLGCKFYHAVRKCSNGHDSPRYVKNGKCVECVAEVHKKNFNVNGDKIRHRSNTRPTEEDKRETKARANAKVRARKLWAHKRSAEIISSCNNIPDEIDKLLQVSYTSSCNKKDILAVIDELHDFSKNLLPRKYVCNLCPSKSGTCKEFTRKSWYDKHVCIPMVVLTKKALDMIEREKKS